MTIVIIFPCTTQQDNNFSLMDQSFRERNYKRTNEINLTNRIAQGESITAYKSRRIRVADFISDGTLDSSPWDDFVQIRLLLSDNVLWLI